MSFTPDSINTLLWLDSDDLTTFTKDLSGVISEWRDKSGNENHFSQSDEALKPILYSGVWFENKFMESAPINGVRSVFFVTDRVMDASADLDICAILGESGVSDHHVFIRRTGNGDISIDGAVGASGEASFNGNPKVAGLNIELGVTEEQQSFPLLWFAEWGTSQTFNNVGRLASSSQQYFFNGRLLEIIFLPQVPTDDERQQLEGYLAKKWGLADKLPSDHPYRDPEEEAAPPAAQTSKVSGVVQIDGTPAERTVRAFGYDPTSHVIDAATVNLSKSLGHAISDPATGVYTIDLLGGYGNEVFVVAFDGYGVDFSASLAVTVGDRVHPTTPNGYVQECTATGILPSTEPTWSTDTTTAQAYGTASMIARVFYRPMVHGPVAPEVTGVVEPAWTPANLFSNNEVGAWYDPSDLSTLFQDAAGTVPVTADNDPVAYMADKSGNGLDASQSDTGSRPVYRTDGTKHWLEFSGAGSRLEVASVDFASSDYVDLFASVEKTTNSESQMVIEFGSVSDFSPGFGLLAPGGGGTNRYAFGLSGGSETAFALTTNSTYDAPRSDLLRGRGQISANICELSINAVFVADDQSNTGSGLLASKSFSIGSRLGGTSLQFSGRIYGIAFLNRNLQGDEMQKTEGYLAHKGGVANKLPDGHLYKTDPPVIEAGPVAPEPSVTPHLMLTMDGTDKGSDFVDSSITTATVTVIGGVTTVDAIAKFGQSAQFDGNNSYLRVGGTQLPAIGTDTFTIEGWIYRKGTNTMPMWSFEDQIHLMTGHSAFNHKVRYWNSAASVYANGTTPLAQDTWYHIALVREADNVRVYVNGVKEIDITESLTLEQKDVLIGALNTNTASGPNIIAGPCNIDDFRLVIGEAIYTADFAPPTASLAG